MLVAPDSTTTTRITTPSSEVPSRRTQILLSSSPCQTLRSLLLLLTVLLCSGCGRLGFGDGLDAGSPGSDGAVDAGLPDDAGADAAVGPFCGDMVVEPPEECDPPLPQPGIGCEMGCVSSFTFTGTMEFLATSPPDLNSGVVESDTIMLIAERMDEILVSDLPIDAFTQGMVPSTTDEGGVIRAGARVRIYLIHQDMLSSVDPIVGTVTFPFDILGLIIQHDSLMATDQPTVTYSPSAARTLEDPNDVVLLGPRTLDLTLLNSSHPDEIRIVVATEEMHGIVVEVP